jgi:hypothetical protein
MPIVTDASAANHVVIRATGKIVKEDFTPFIPEFERLVKERGKLRVLFDVTEFTGWGSGALWQEVKFDLKHLSDIERLAVLGTKAWQHALEAAMKPFAHPRTRYFDAAEITAAHDWLIRP